MLAYPNASLRFSSATIIQLPHPLVSRSIVRACSIPRLPTTSPRRLDPLHPMCALPTPSIGAPEADVRVEEPWYAAYPQPRSTPTPIVRAELLDLLKSGSQVTNLVLVDLRRTDFVV